MAKEPSKNDTSGNSTLWNVVNDLRGMFDPEIDDFAEWFAGKVPENSFLRSDKFARIFGVLKQHVERRGNSMGPAGRVMVEAVTDLGDYVTAALHGGKKVEAEKPIGEGWINKFKDDAVKRLAKAQDVAAETEHLKAEFKARQELIKSIEEILSQSTGKNVKSKVTDSKWEDYLKTLKDVDEKVASWFDSLIVTQKMNGE
jgi:hypothetical protein